MSRMWSHERVQYFNSMLTQAKFSPGDIIYDIGQKPDVMYILKCGQLVMESQVDIEHTNKYPVGLNEWETRNTCQTIEFQVRKFSTGEVFGHQELVEHILQEQF